MYTERVKRSEGRREGEKNIRMYRQRVLRASHLTTFYRLALPLSIAGIAAFATFQFLWVYNDFLVANVFLGINPRNQVITSHVAQLTVGNYGEAWHLRTAGAVISMIVPLIVFFSLQRFFIRGLIGGAVKG